MASDEKERGDRERGDREMFDSRCLLVAYLLV
jgi:hypothetical protein